MTAPPASPARAGLAAHADRGPHRAAAARAAGLSDEEIAETIGHVALNVLTNYVNKATRGALGFPAVAA